MLLSTKNKKYSIILYGKYTKRFQEIKQLYIYIAVHLRLIFFTITTIAQGAYTADTNVIRSISAYNQ